MYNKSKNKVLFAVFILVVLLIVFILVLSVYNTKEHSNVEEYKISLNNFAYDKDYKYINLKKEAVLKKEWDGNYYLYEDNNSKKYELGIKPVLYDKSKKTITVYGNVHQVFSNGDITEKKGNTVVNNLSDFQFFKLDDREYLIIGNSIKSESISTENYLLVSIDKAGNATLLNNSVNIKTINPLILTVENVNFDIANEKLLIGEEKVDLKKINGSTNEYVEKEEPEEKEEIIETPSIEQNNNQNNGNSNNNSNNNANNNVNTGNSDSAVYTEIINQIINISGLISNTTTKINLYKNISLRGINVGASYLEIDYSVIDPEDKYLSVFLTIEDEQKNINYYYLSKEDVSYRIAGLIPNNQYKIALNYIARGDSSTIVADSIIAITSDDPTTIRLTKINGTKLTYKVKMYNEYGFSSANVILTNCEDSSYLGINQLNIENALSVNGDVGEFILDSNFNNEYVCLRLASVKDASNNDVNINSYHKVKIK